MNGKAPVDIKGWVPFGYVEDTMVEDGYQLCVREYTAKGNTAGLTALEVERKGGLCHYCDAPFHEIVVNSQYGHFSYFEPTCQCYKRCSILPVEEGGKRKGNAAGCRRWMVEERFRNLSLCLRCYGEPRAHKESERKPRKKEYGGKEAAAGEAD
jgi:hypothetical protein